MNPKTLSTSFYVSAQLTENDLRDAAAAGFRTIINNRPDSEEAGQPLSNDLAAVAQRLGLEYIAIPVCGSGMTDASIDTFCEVVDDCETPILAFCRSGMRSSALWAMHAVRTTDVDTVLAATKAAGYELEPLRERLTASR